MFRNEQVAKRFAEGYTKGTGSHLFIDGDTVYSYGRHFPIAKRIGEKEVFFNSERYSSFTSKHQRLVRVVLEEKNYTMWEAPSSVIESFPDVRVFLRNWIEYFFYLTKDLQSKIPKARSNLPYYIKDLIELKLYWGRVKERFGLESKELDHTFLFITKEELRSKQVADKLNQVA
jgi:hypothetical protein